MHTAVWFSLKNIVLSFQTGSVVATPLPDGTTLQTIQTALAALPKTVAGSRSASDPETWGQ